MLFVVAKLTAKKEHIKSVQKAMLEMVVPTVQEKGCIYYHPHQDQETENIFFFTELWASEKALDDHAGSSHFKVFAEKLNDLLAFPIEIHKLNKFETITDEVL